MRIWDVRKAGGAVGLLDQEDSLGLFYNGMLGSDGVVRKRLSTRAHAGPVNGLAWTDDGNYLISAAHDRRIRIWDAATGANTLASFGPSLKNGQLTSVTMFSSPAGLTHATRELLFWPNETEILALGLHDGRIVTRLRSTDPTMAGVRSASGAERTARTRMPAE